MKPMRTVLILIAFVGVASADGAAWLIAKPEPVKRDTVPRGILIYREVYDYDGKRIAIEESSDAPKRTTPKAAPAPTPKARTEATTEYKWIGGYWYKSTDGGDWNLCRECMGLPGPNGETARSVPQTFPSTPVMIVPAVPVRSTSSRAGFQAGSMFIGASGAASRGGIGSGG